MFKMYLDNKILWTPRDPGSKILNPTVNLSVNSVGSASFKILPTHKYYDAFTRMVSIISVLENDRIIFKGRVYSDKQDFRKNKTIEVEGLLGYFNDSIVRAYEFTGSPEEYLTFLINQHNDQVEDHQKFKLGRVTVVDNNDYIVRANTNYPTTWKEIEDKLINILGGYIDIRYEEDGNYIDYLADYEDRSTQEIRFSLNLLDLETSCNAENLATCIIAYGAKDEETGEVLDLKEVNGGLDYVCDPEAVALYGKIFEVVTWEDVTIASNLLTKAKLYLSTRVKLTSKIKVKAIDLHLTDEDIESFKKGDYVRVYSEPHGIDDIALITDYNIDLADPPKSIFTLGLEKESYLETSKRESSNRIDVVRKEIGNTITQKTANILSETQIYVNDAVENSEETTRSMLKEYALVTDIDELKESVSTQFSQTAEEFSMRFTSIDERITEENGEIVNRVDEISRYIRFKDGDLLLGEVGNDLTTKISNGRISFIYNDTIEVAYISDRKLYITQAEILDRIIIGNFAFVPRSNGNLSFMKI